MSHITPLRAKQQFTSEHTNSQNSIQQTFGSEQIIMHTNLDPEAIQTILSADPNAIVTLVMQDDNDEQNVQDRQFKL